MLTIWAKNILPQIEATYTIYTLRARQERNMSQSTRERKVEVLQRQIGDNTSCITCESKPAHLQNTFFGFSVVKADQASGWTVRLDLGT